MISPQGYNLGEDPKAKNPFWDGEGEDSDVNRIFATAEITGGTGTPSVQTSKTVSGHDITFGFSFNNLKGETGAQGERGLQGIQGERGPAGPTGETGPAGPAGETGPAGPAGPAGANGADGVSPTIDVVTITGGHRVDITDAQGTESFNVLDGQDGAPGAPGQNGQNGQDGVTPDITVTATADATASASPTVTVTKSGTAANPAFALAFSGLKGETGPQGATGSQGPQGPAGSTGPQGPAGPGVPTGGTAGQVLQKVDGTDYNTEWATPSGGGGYTPKKYTYSGTPTIEVVRAAKQNDGTDASMVRVHVGYIDWNATFTTGSETLSMSDVGSLVEQGKGYLMIYGRYYNSRPYSDVRYYLPASLTMSRSVYYVDAVGWNFDYSTEFGLYFIRTAQ